MIQVFNEAEDLESLDDLHILCAMMQTIREWSLPLGSIVPPLRPEHPQVALNDNTMYEHLVQDDLFLGVVGILECQSRVALPLLLSSTDLVIF